MAKIYISGAITGVAGYIEKFKRAEEYLTYLGYSVVNPARVNAEMPSDMTYEEYMKMSLCMLEICDSIYMLSDWETSKGATEEHEKAIELRKNIYYQSDEWKERMLRQFISR